MRKNIQPNQVNDEIARLRDLPDRQSLARVTIRKTLTNFLSTKP